MAMTLKEIYAPIKADMEQVEKVLKKELSVDSARVKDLVNHVAGYRGKRMRPALAMLTGKCFGDIGEAHVLLGAIVELIHTATLIHDDILDEAQMRRGIPTISAKWGTEISVLLGDYIFSRAFEVLSRFDGSECLPLLTQTTNKMCKGELIQLRTRYVMDLKEADYLQIAELKTASLCGVSTQLGAKLAGASPELVERFYNFGLNLGIAFQITDDCLDIIGKENVVGKSLGTDLGQGKLTLPVIRLMEQLDRKESREVARIVEEGFPPASRNRFQELVRKHGTVESSIEKSRELLENARQQIEDVPDCPARQCLFGLCDYILSREL